MTSVEERLDQRYEWIEPATLEEAEQRRANALDRKIDIETQLAERDRRGPDGERLNDHEYHLWRQRAVWAKRFQEKEAASLKAWIKAAHLRGAERRATVVPDNEDVWLMHALYRMVRIVEGERVEWAAYSPEEQVLLNLAQGRLRAFGVLDDESGI